MAVALGGGDRWRSEVAIGGRFGAGERRWRAEVASGGRELRYYTEVAIGGGAGRWRSAVAVALGGCYLWVAIGGDGELEMRVVTCERLRLKRERQRGN